MLESEIGTMTNQNGDHGWRISVNDMGFAYSTNKGNQVVARPVLAHCTARFVSGNSYAILGENGAGKTTLLDLLTGNLRPTFGAIRYAYWNDGREKEDVGDGHYPVASAGYMSSDFIPYEELTVRQSVELVSMLRNIDNCVVEQSLSLVHTLELERYWNQPLEELSMGTRMRVHLLLTVLHDPAIIILDEPTNGLDPRQFHIFERIVETWRDSGKLVIISTHSLLLAAQIASAVMLLRDGQLRELESGDLKAMEREFGE